MILKILLHYALEWGHDFIEDTPLGYSDIRAALGIAVANIIRECSVDTRKSKQERRPEVLATAMTMSRPAAYVKAADMIDNLTHMQGTWDKDKQRSYLVAKREVFNAMGEFNENVDINESIFMQLMSLIYELEEKLAPIRN